MKYLLLISLVLLGMSGCGSEKRVVVEKQKSLPSWYTKPPKSTSEDLYALGEGKDKKEAISEALSYMVSTLSVSISSSYNAKTVVKEGAVNSSSGIYKSNIQSDVQKIRISNYEIIESKNLGFKRYAVLIKSNKKKLFSSMNQELRQKFAVIKSEEKVFANADALKKLSYYRKQLASLDSLENTLIVMNALKSSFHGKKYLQMREELNIKYHYLIENISFSIESNKDATSLKSVIAKALSKKHFKIEKKKSPLHFKITINAKINRAEAYGFTLARTAIRLITKDAKGVIIGSNVVNVVGQSSQGYKIAKQNVAIRVGMLIKEEGIAKVLALPI